MALTDQLTAIADAIRAKTGKTAAMTLDQMPGEISGITGGGSGANPDANDPVYYVTFMNGNDVLYVRPVAKNDNCADVLTKGLIETPTKESTVQYNYTYYGWGAADNGAADSTILQNITEDKTVYAIFTAAARYYTITYLDDDGVTVLKTQNLAYGATPTSYTPIKDGYAFKGWAPALATVTGDASYVASWQKVEYTVIIPEQSLYTPSVSGNGAYGIIAGIAVGLELGATYRVSWKNAGSTTTYQYTHVATRYTINYQNYTQGIYIGVGNPWKVGQKDSINIKSVSDWDGNAISNIGNYFIRSAADGDTYQWYIHTLSPNTHNVKVEKITTGE